MTAVGGAMAAPPTPVAAVAASQAAETGRIERLLAMIEQSTDIAYVRIGTAYDAPTAARFLRLKWDFMRAKVRSAEDFVREVATRSGTTGTPYLVRYADGREENSAVYLRRFLDQQAGATGGTR